MLTNNHNAKIKVHRRFPGQDSILSLQRTVGSICKDNTVCCSLPDCKVMIGIQSKRWIPGQDNILSLRHAVDSVRKDITVCCPLPACKTMIEIQSSRWYSGQDGVLSLQPLKNMREYLNESFV